MDLDELNAQIVDCRRCPRLVAWREQVARVKRRAFLREAYWGRPVPGFGDPRARILIVGLAPGAHGSNRTGRPFTGDASGRFLYPALHRAGFANQSACNARDDGLILRDVYITAAVRCVPPANKPLPAELENCQPYLEHELQILRPRVVVCLGRIAFDRLLKVHALPRKEYTFTHGAAYKTPAGTWLLGSYHPSQQNTQTGKLTQEMFDAIWDRAKQLVQA